MLHVQCMKILPSNLLFLLPHLIFLLILLLLLLYNKNIIAELFKRLSGKTLTLATKNDTDAVSMNLFFNL